jgi:hypothetical protein
MALGRQPPCAQRDDLEQPLTRTDLRHRDRGDTETTPWWRWQHERRAARRARSKVTHLQVHARRLDVAHSAGNRHRAPRPRAASRYPLYRAARANARIGWKDRSGIKRTTQIRQVPSGSIDCWHLFFEQQQQQHNAPPFSEAAHETQGRSAAPLPAAEGDTQANQVVVCAQRSKRFDRQRGKARDVPS